MPKLIEGYEAAICKSIRRISDMPYKIWNWREEYVALIGILLIFESEKKHPGILHPFYEFGVRPYNGMRRDSQ